MEILVLAGLAFWIWAIVDAAKPTDAQYRAIGESKTVWLLIIAVTGGIGALVYLLLARPKLQRV